jgi:regulator of sigma E protease
MTIIIFLFVLLLVVVVHEAGHFFAAKQMGMRVREFAFGFPPRLFGIKRGETTYSFNAIPLGGYVSIDGENGNTSGEPDTKLFTNKTKLAQAWVLFAGPLMNIVLAFVLLSISFMVGYNNDADSNGTVAILSINKNSPAEIAGIKPGDKIKSIYKNGNTEEIINPDVEIFQNLIQTGEVITVNILRDGKNKTFDIKPELIDSSYRIGVSLGKLDAQKLGFFAAIKQGFNSTLDFTWGTISGFAKIIGSLFTGSDIKANLTGPIGIAREVGTASIFGFAYLLSFVSIISINLGVLNLFPFPALDGGRLLFLLIEKIKGSPIKAKTSNIVNIAGFGILILLMIIVTIKDVIRLF